MALLPNDFKLYIYCEKGLLKNFLILRAPLANCGFRSRNILGFMLAPSDRLSFSNSVRSYEKISQGSCDFELHCVGIYSFSTKFGNRVYY